MTYVGCGGPVCNPGMWEMKAEVQEFKVTLGYTKECGASLDYMHFKANK